MKKTISVNLNRQIFNLDIDAYSKLDEYFSDIKKHFSDQDSIEIIDDIESRIAEKFSEILGKTKKVIQIEDVDHVIQEMGSISDITGDEDNSEAKNSLSRKKLFRDIDRKIIAGVASGLSWYFGIQSIFIRLIFVVLFLNPNTFWLALIIYFACWLIIPKAENNFEKLEMKGRPATINELHSATESKISGVISSLENKSQSLLQKISSSFGHLIKFFIKLSLRLLGFFSFIFTIFCIVAVVVGLVVLYFNPTLPYFDFSFIRSISSPFLEIGFISFGLVLLLPLVFILDLFENLMQLKWDTSFKKVLVLLAIWVSSLITFASIAKITYPSYQSGLSAFTNHLKYFNFIDKSNSQTFEISNPNSVDISNVKQVKITQSDENIMVVTGNQHQINELKIQNNSDLLSVQGKNEVWFGCTDCTGYVSSVLVDVKTHNPNLIKLDNVDGEIYSNSGDWHIDLVKKVGLKIIGSLNTLKVTANQSIINLFEAKNNQLDAALSQSVLKSGANVISIIGDDQSRLIYKSNSQIYSQDNDKTVIQKYSLSRDDYSKLSKAVDEVILSFDNQSRTVKDFSSSQFLFQLVDDYSNIFLIAKPQSDKSDLYLFWLTENDEKISQLSYIKLPNWYNWNNFNFVNETLLEINGQIYSPEMESVSQQIFANKNTNKLELYIPSISH